MTREAEDKLARWSMIGGALLALVTTMVTVIIFAARVTPAIDNLASAVKDLSMQVSAQETRLSRIEGQLNVVPYRR